MNSDVTILKGTNSGAFGSNFLVSNGINVIPVKYHFRLARYLSFICHILKLYSPFLLNLFFSIDPKQFSNSPTIIIFDSSIKYYICGFLQKHHSDKKLILYFWNIITTKNKRQIAHLRHSWDIFSFSLDDCNKYNLKYNKLFFLIPKDFTTRFFEIKQDVFFAGKNKGRINEIVRTMEEFDKTGISYKIICTEINEKLYPNIFSKGIPYEEILFEDMSSKAILDINTDDEYGMTMREMEALYFKKKLITNNAVIKDRDYYHENNVFIIDYSKKHILEGLKDFLEKPFADIDNEILESYSIESWIQRFIDS